MRCHCSILYFSLLTLTICNGNVVRSHGPLSVSFGKRTTVQRSTLRIRPQNRDGDCTVRVLYNEVSLDASVGRLFPPFFPCNFREGDVYYEHFGLPLSTASSVNLLLTYMDDSEKISVPVSMKIEVTNLTNDIVFKNGGLAVTNFNGYSQPITGSNLGIRYDRGRHSCHISLRNGATVHSWPR